MSTGLILPRHVAAMERARRTQTALTVAPSTSPVKHALNTDDFITPDQVAEQVSAFVHFKDAGGTVPQPVGWRVAVLVLTIPEITTGNLIMVDDHREARSLASPQGVVVAVGPTAYQDAARFPEKAPWVKVGDRVMFQKYGGRMFQMSNGQHLAFLNDTEFAGVVDTGWLADAGGDE